jgi:hypothetical protein
MLENVGDVARIKGIVMRGFDMMKIMISAEGTNARGEETRNHHSYYSNRNCKFIVKYLSLSLSINDPLPFKRQELVKRHSL